MKANRSTCYAKAQKEPDEAMCCTPGNEDKNMRSTSGEVDAVQVT